MRREEKKMAVGFTIAVVVVGSCLMAYLALRTYQKQAAVQLLVGDRPEETLETLEARLPSIPEDVQRLVYERALIVAENILSLLTNGGPVSSNQDDRGLANDAIHRIALGNAIQDEDVISIVRWGWANNW